MIFGGMIGLERGRKHRAAGFRTYMLVCLGATLTSILSQYLYVRLDTDWLGFAETTSRQIDVSRFGAQVYSGIGFLAAGTIIVTGRQEVKGLTTAAGLWASACMGIAIGAGFYECVVIAFVLMFLCIHFLPVLEVYLLENARNMNIYVELKSLDEIGVRNEKEDWRIAWRCQDTEYSNLRCGDRSRRGRAPSLSQCGAQRPTGASPTAPAGIGGAV